MRADIHDGPEQMLQSEAGYIDARPLTANSAKPLATHGRTIHLGHVWTAPWQELFDASAALVGCGHVSGLLIRCRRAGAVHSIKSGKARNEQMFSALLPKADIGSPGGLPPRRKWFPARPWQRIYRAAFSVPRAVPSRFRCNSSNRRIISRERSDSTITILRWSCRKQDAASGLVASTVL